MKNSKGVVPYVINKDGYKELDSNKYKEWIKHIFSQQGNHQIIIPLDKYCIEQLEKLSKDD